MKWSLRPVEIRDVPIFLDWYNNESLHNIANATKFKPYTLEQLTDYWTEKLSRSNANYYAILLNNQVIGRVGLKKAVREEGYCADYSILIGVPTLHSKGFGTEITKHVVAQAFSDTDILSVVLEVREDNKRAIKCYEKAGFKINRSFYENNIKMYEMIVHKG